MKILFLGLGGVGQRHLRNLLRLIPNAKFGAVRHNNRTFEIGNDLKADQSVNIIEKYNIKNFTSLRKGIDWSPKFAVVSTPSHYHVKPSIQLVKNNIPVFLEKPISHNYDHLDDLLKLVKKQKTIVMVGYMLRFHPGIIKMLQALNDGAIGEIYSAQITACSYLPSWHPYEKYNQFYAGISDLGGGVILTSIHPVDLIYAMFGKPVSLNTYGGKVSNLDIDVEDTISALFNYKISNRNIPVTLTMSFVQRPPFHQIDIWGERGKLIWNENSGIFSINNVEDDNVMSFDNENFERNDLFIDEMKHFLHCLETDEQPITSIQNVIDGHIIALQMKESLKTSRVVYLS